MTTWKTHSVTMIMFLPALVGPLACSDGDPTGPASNGSPPTGAVRVEVSPDGCPATWRLTDADDNTHDGCGDSLLAGIVAGECEMVWNSLEDYRPPDPSRETRSVTEDDTVSFSVTYVAEPAPPVKVLFLGSSYFGANYLVKLFSALAKDGGHAVEIDGHYPSGLYLDYHADSATTDALIRSRAWDYVILQGVGRITAYPDDAHFDLRATLGALEQKIHRSSGEAKVMFQMPWAFEDGMLWTPGGTDDYFAMQQRILDRTLEHAAALDIEIAPVGWAWNAIMEEAPPEHYLFERDWNHPSLRGTYLMACVFYASVFLESVEGGAFYGGVPAGEASHLQAVGSNTVLDGLDRWHLEEDESR